MKEFQLQFISNKQIVRTLKILSLLQNHSYITLKELASGTNSSDRTILTDIHRIKDYFSQTVDLEATPIGYVFTILSLNAYSEKKRALLENEPLFRVIESIFFNECQTLDEWSDQLFTTVSSLSKLFNSITPILKSYGLSLSNDPVDFIGNEINIRHFFHDFYYESDITPHTVFPSLAVQEISSTLTKHNFFKEYSYISFTDFNYIVFITLTRFSSGKEVKSLNRNALFLKDFLVAHLKTVDMSIVRELIKKHFNTQLTEIEAVYLYTQLVTRRSVLSVEAEKIFIDRFKLWPELKPIANEYMLLIDTPEKYRKDSLIYFESFFISVKIKQCFSPVLNQNLDDITTSVKKNFSNEFQNTYAFIATCLAKENQLSNRQITDITANLVLLTDSLRNFYWTSSKNIAILLEGNRFLVENIRSTAQRYIGKHYPLFFPDVTALSADYFQTHNIDLIVTNYNDYLVNLDYGIPVVLFELVPSKTDWYHLFQLLSPNLLRII